MCVYVFYINRYAFFENGSLKMTDVSSVDAGSYTCEVETDMDTEKATASITVVGEDDDLHLPLVI